MFITFLYPAIFLLLLALTVFGIILYIRKRYLLLAKILLSFTGAFWLAIAVLILMLFFALTGSGGNFSFVLIGCIGALIYLTLLAKLWNLLKKKAVWIGLVSIASAFVLCASIHIGYHAYLDSIPTMDENADLLPAYAPYAPDTKAVTLANPQVPLHLSENLPVMDGATALFPVYSSFAKAVYPESILQNWDQYDDLSPLQCTKTNGAYEALIEGRADIIFVSGPSKQQEAWAKEMNVTLNYTPIGHEAFVFFVNANNPLQEINVDQIKGIYSGQITKWSELGVDGLGSIRAFQRPENSGSQTRLQKLMGDTPLMEAPTTDVISGMGGIIRETADYKNHKNAIGYSFRFYSTEMVQNNQIRHLLVEGVAPTLENIENGTYPLSGTFYAVTRSDADDNTKKLLDWITGPDGQEIIKQIGYTPLSDQQ